MIIYC